MSHIRLANQIIQSLTRSDVRAQCPCCDLPISLRAAGLFYLNNFSAKGHDLHNQMLTGIKDQRQELRDQRRHISRSSQTTAKAVNLGFLYEKMAPSLPTFPFRPYDCRFLGMPVDVLVFEGLSKAGGVQRILFGDIKTGAARLSERQRAIRTAVEKRRVEWGVYP